MKPISACSCASSSNEYCSRDPSCSAHDTPSDACRINSQHQGTLVARRRNAQCSSTDIVGELKAPGYDVLSLGPGTAAYVLPQRLQVNSQSHEGSSTRVYFPHTQSIPNSGPEGISVGKVFRALMSCPGRPARMMRKKQRRWKSCSVGC